MSSLSGPLFGIHERALNVWDRRMDVLGSNLANADTPHYKARDIDFREALSSSNKPGLDLVTTNRRHIAGGNPYSPALKYRLPMQPSEDGNTVESNVAQAAFAQNTVHYQASLSFITNKVHQLRLAIQGR